MPYKDDFEEWMETAEAKAMLKEIDEDDEE